MDYVKYVEALNRGDDRAFAEAWLTEDCTFRLAARKFDGREAVIAFLEGAHDGIHEVLRPQMVLRDGDHLFCEADIDFHATRDLPGRAAGALSAGEFQTVKFFLHYTIRGDRVCALDMAWWPAEVGVTKP